MLAEGWRVAALEGLASGLIESAQGIKDRGASGAVEVEKDEAGEHVFTWLGDRPHGCQLDKPIHA